MPSTKSRTKLKFEAIGVPWEIEIFDRSLDSATKTAIQDRIDTFDKTYSRFRSDSWVAEVASHSGRHRLPADAGPLFRLYDELYKITGGLFTPLIGQNLSEAGYDQNYSFEPITLTDLPRWSEVQKRTGQFFVTSQTIQLDFGAAGKGYLVDCVAELLQTAGYEAYVIDASGDILVRGVASAQRIGLENPAATGEVIGVLPIINGALCASAGNRRVWKGFHHIINPVTKQSPKHVLATWVLADTALLADGLSTALFFAPAETLQKQYTFEYAVITSGQQGAEIHTSDNFSAEFFQ